MPAAGFDGTIRNGELWLGGKVDAAARRHLGDFPSNEMAWKLGTDIQNMTTYTGLISKDSPLLYGYITHKATSSGMICIAICEKSLSQRKLHTRHLFPASHSLTGPLRPQNPKFERPTAQPALVFTGPHLCHARDSIFLVPMPKLVSLFLSTSSLPFSSFLGCTGIGTLYPSEGEPWCELVGGNGRGFEKEKKA